MEKVIYVWQNKLSSTMIYADSVSFLSEVFVDVWLSLDKSMGEFSMAYKKISALLWLRVYNHDFGLYLVQLHKVCLFRMRFSLSVSGACLVICKSARSARKWYEMRLCIT